MKTILLSLCIIGILTACHFDSSQPPPPTWTWAIDIVNPPAPEKALTLPTVHDGKLYHGKKVLLYLADRHPYCDGVEISYSPTSKFFLAIVQCNEGLNSAYLFKAEGGHGIRITGNDTIQDSRHQWSPNEKSLVYLRAAGLSDYKPNLPGGLVLYSIPTGNKTLLRTYFDYSSTKAKWSPNGDWFAYTIACQVILAKFDGSAVWKIDEVPDCANANNKVFAWEHEKDTVVLKYNSADLSINRTYHILPHPTQQPTPEAQLIDTNDVLMGWDEIWENIK